MDNYKIVTLAEQPELVKEMNELHQLGWSKFMLQDEVANRYFHYLPNIFPEFQFLMMSDEGQAVACGNAVAFRWDGSEEDLPLGWDDVIERSVKEHQAGIKANAVSAIAIVVNPQFRGSKISEIMVREMKKLVRKSRFTQMVAPVRPSLKHKYPLTPMESYVEWTIDGVCPFDPWLRIHWKSNAHIVKVANASMVIKGTVADWEAWTEMRFPESGKYVIPAALTPIEISIDNNLGVYIEPNVWMKHVL